MSNHDLFNEGYEAVEQLKRTFIQSFISVLKWKLRILVGEFGESPRECIAHLIILLGMLLFFAGIITMGWGLATSLRTSVVSWGILIFLISIPVNMLGEAIEHRFRLTELWESSHTWLGLFRYPLYFMAVFPNGVGDHYVPHALPHTPISPPAGFNTSNQGQLGIKVQSDGSQTVTFQTKDGPMTMTVTPKPRSMPESLVNHLEQMHISPEQHQPDAKNEPDKLKEVLETAESIDEADVVQETKKIEKNLSQNIDEDE